MYEGRQTIFVIMFIYVSRSVYAFRLSKFHILLSVYFLLSIPSHKPVGTYCFTTSYLLRRYLGIYAEEPP